MGIRKYIAAGLIGITAGIAAPCMLGSRDNEKPAGEQCNGTEVADTCFDIEHSRVIDSYTGNHERVFVLVYEIHPNERDEVNIKHDASRVQANVFLTLEELLTENGANFIAVENFVGELSHATIRGNRRTSFEYAERYAEIAALPYNLRRERIIQGLMDKSLPEIGSIMFEMMYQAAVFTFGMDDVRLHTLALELKGKKGRKNEYEDVAVTRRSYTFLDNIFEYLDNNPGTGNVIVISTGLMHRTILEMELRKKGMSYIALIPEGLGDAVKGVLDKNKIQELLGKSH